MVTNRTPGPRVTFADTPAQVIPQPLHDRNFEEVEPGRFCAYLQSEGQARLCLKLEDDKLLRALGVEPLQKTVEHAPSISLATLLKRYPSLTPKMRAALAYILAQSVWHYYDSDWMSVPWSRDSIHFLSHVENDSSDGRGVHACKPYLSVQFGPEGRGDHVDFGQGEIHRFPRVRMLGIMLLEIALGFPLPPPARTLTNQSAIVNDEWARAKGLSERPWSDFDYPKYRLAVKNCLDHKIFSEVPTEPNATEAELERQLDKRREILYTRVVSPLEQLLEGTGWLEEINRFEALRLPSSLDAEPEMDELSTKKRQLAMPPTKPSRAWMRRVQLLSRTLKSVGRQAGASERVSVAILDTGYDPDSGSGFFDHGSVNNHLKGWKDFVGAGDRPQDTDGHGTHTVSLLMQVAPEADIFVARVARNSKELETCSENVAQVRKLTRRTI